MEPLVRATAQLQHLVLRLIGVLLTVVLGVYLVAWATDPPPRWLSAMALGVLALSGAWHAKQLVKRGSAGLGIETEISLFASLIVATYAVILHLPLGLSGPYYALVYVALMVAAAYSRPAAAVTTVAFAAATEAGLRAVAFGQTDWSSIWPRLGFLVLFTALNSVLFRAEIARVRRLSRGRVEGEIERLKDAARVYRLSGGEEEREGQDLHSAAHEMQQASLFALTLLKESLGLSSAVLLSLDGGRLSIFEATSDHVLLGEPLSAGDGIFSAALRRKESISVTGSRASRHALVYAEPQTIGALCVVPLLEGSHPRALLLVDRQEEREFDDDAHRMLEHSAEFLLRAMQNERVFASLTRANREQAKLYRAAEALGAATTEAEVIEAGVESAREVAAFDFAAVTLFQRKTSTHEICAVSGDEGVDGLVDRSFRHNAGLVSMVVANRHPLPYRGEYDPSRQTVFARGFEPPKMPSLLVLPLMVHDRVLGTLVLGSRQRGAFSESVRPALEVLASHMAVSMKSARMLKVLEEQATTDGMTGLLNKRTLIREAERRLKAAARFKKPLSILVTDIDHFKKVNDNYGHDVGDVVIKGLGDVLRRVKRDTDIVGRFGGEEFVIVCEQTDEEGATNLAERIRRELENTTFQTELGPLSVTGSVGVAPFPAAGQDWTSLFKATDEALYVSKRGGRNKVTVWSPRMRSTSAA